jgi:hypothetical protein
MYIMIDKSHFEDSILGKSFHVVKQFFLNCALPTFDFSKEVNHPPIHFLL